MTNIDGLTRTGLDTTPPAAYHGTTGAPAAARALLEDFGRNIGLPTLHFNEENSCWLQINADYFICITAQPADESIRIHGEVSQLSLERDTPDLALYFRHLLQMNVEATSAGEDTTFAIDPRRNALILAANLPVTATQQQLQDILKQLLARIETLQTNPPTIHGLKNAREKTLSSYNMAREFKLMTEPPPLSDEILLRV